MANNDPELSVEVAYVNDRQSSLLELNVSDGTTVAEAIKLSGILQQCPEIDLGKNKVGIYSRVCGLDESVRDGDRIEIYRPLLADPKDSRRKRADTQRKNKTTSTGRVPDKSSSEAG